MALLLAGGAAAGEGVLPQGAAPAALTSPHFPDRVHEFVWRNWNAVTPDKLAGRAVRRIKYKKRGALCYLSEERRRSKTGCAWRFPDE